MSSVFVMAMSSIFMIADCFQLCVSNEFRLCDGVVMWPWVGFFSLEQCCYCSQCIVCSFMLKYFKKALCCIVLIILVILPMEMDLLDFHENSQIIICFCKMFIIMRFTFPPPLLIMLLIGL